MAKEIPIHQQEKPVVRFGP